MDLRTIRTRQAIKDAFLKLRKKKAIEKITIQEIADIAMINKSTFYRHFEDIYQLSDELENEVIDKCLENAGSTDERFFSALLTILRYTILFSPAAERMLPSISCTKNIWRYCSRHTLK